MNVSKVVKENKIVQTHLIICDDEANKMLQEHPRRERGELLVAYLARLVSGCVVWMRR
jgi:hypothetical protein